MPASNPIRMFQVSFIQLPHPPWHFGLHKVLSSQDKECLLI